MRGVAAAADEGAMMVVPAAGLEPAPKGTHVVSSASAAPPYSPASAISATPDIRSVHVQEAASTDDLRRIATDDQFVTERREARMLATALGEDVAAYHTALKTGGIDGDLLHDLSVHFAERWIGPDIDPTILLNIGGTDE